MEGSPQRQIDGINNLNFQSDIQGKWLMQRKIFISHTECDKQWAILIGEVLERKGHLVKAMYKRSFHGNYDKEIDKAIKESDDFFFVFSSAFEKSTECQVEWSLAHNKEKKGTKTILHPIKVESYIIESPSRSGYDFIDISLYKQPNSPGVESYLKEEIGKIFGEDIIEKPPRMPLNNLPSRYPNFTGRKKIIKELHRELSLGQRQHSIQVLTGLGGVGKTKIALEYAYSHLDDYRLIWYFHAEEKPALMQAVSELAKILYPGERHDNIDLHIASLRRYLENNDRWLLIFDNATTPEDLEWVFPAVMRGNIIITSRTTDWGTLACISSIRPFSAKESVEFMEKRLHRTRERSCYKSISQELDYIPIVLEFAAAYMDSSRINCEEYRNILKENPVPFPLAKVWGTSFKKIKETKINDGKIERRIGEKSIALLECLSYFSPDDIPEEVIYPVLSHTPDLSDHVKNKAGYLEILSLLLKYSFVSKDIDSRALSMHRIVQKAVRDAMGEEIKKKKAASTVENLSELFPIKSDDPETIDRDMWTKCQQMLPHAAHAAGIADELAASPIATLHLYAQIASFLRELDNLKEAEEFARKSVKIASINKETIHYAISLETLARILRDQGRNSEAQNLMLEAIRVEENLHQCLTTPEKYKLSDRDLRHLAICYDGYGRILSNLGRSEEALSFYNKALSRDIQSYGEKHAKIAIRKNNIAIAYGDLGKEDLEIRYLKEALSIEEEYYKRNHPYIAIRLSILASIYERGEKTPEKRKECLDRALAYRLRAFEIDKGFYGPGHHSTLSRINGLARHYSVREDFEKALEWNTNAVEITRNEEPGGYHQGMSLLHRGNSYVDMKDYPSALKDYELALALVSKNRGEENCDCSVVLKNMAYIKSKQQDYAHAADYLKRAIEIDESGNHEKRRTDIINLLNLAYYYSQSDNLTNAKSSFEKARDISISRWGQKSPEWSMVLKDMAYFEGRQKNYLKAAEHLATALKIDRSADLAQSRDYCIHESNLGYFYYHLGDLVKAKTCLEQTLLQAEMVCGVNSRDYLNILTTYINIKTAANDSDGIAGLIAKYESIRADLNEDQTK